MDLSLPWRVVIVVMVVVVAVHRVDGTLLHDVVHIVVLMGVEAIRQGVW